MLRSWLAYPGVLGQAVAESLFEVIVSSGFLKDPEGPERVAS